jgi:hypothetical protein
MREKQIHDYRSSLSSGKLDASNIEGLPVGFQGTAKDLFDAWDAVPALSPQDSEAALRKKAEVRDPGPLSTA